jgi:hypothetical protein
VDDLAAVGMCRHRIDPIDACAHRNLLAVNADLGCAVDQGAAARA